MDERQGEDQPDIPVTLTKNASTPCQNCTQTRPPRPACTSAAGRPNASPC